MGSGACGQAAATILGKDWLVTATRKDLSFAQQIAIDRHYNVYDLGGNWDPFDRTIPTDCSGCVIDECDASINGTAMQWRRNADGGGGSTEDWRPPSLGGNADPSNGPFGSIMVNDPSEFPSDAAVLIALHHGDGSAEDSHMWCQVDQLKIETHGSDDTYPDGATVLYDGVNFHDIVLDVHTVDSPTTYGANNWWYLPGPIVEDGTPIPTGPSPTGGQNPVTLFGVDVSNNNFGGENSPNLTAAAAFTNALPGEGFSWIEAKATQGSTFVDPTWATIFKAATAISFPIVAFHYVDTTDPGAQAANAASVAGARNVGWMMDFEQDSGDINNLQAVLAAFQAAGLTVVVDYLPAWYLAQIGSPTLSGVPGLISSAYPGGAGYASTLYEAGGGDQGEGWQPYDGETPVIWQFTDSANVAGITVDADAFVGSEAQLLALLTPGGTVQPTPPAPTSNPPAIPKPSDEATQDSELWDQELLRWDFLGNRTVAETVGAIAAALKIPGCTDPLGDN